MYAIINLLNEHWVYGTDFTQTPYRQKCSNRNAIVFNTIERANKEYIRRMCNENFKVVKVKMIPLNEDGKLII